MFITATLVSTQCELIAMTDGQRYPFYNHRGDVINVTDDAGNILLDHAYDAFGREMNDDRFSGYGHSGKDFNPETGLAYFGYRFYMPDVGRWLTRDPIGFAGGLNFYGYVGNNPVMYIDPNGETPIFAVAALMGCFSGVVYSYTFQAVVSINCGTDFWTPEFSVDTITNCIIGALVMGGATLIASGASTLATVTYAGMPFSFLAPAVPTTIGEAMLVSTIGSVMLASLKAAIKCEVRKVLYPNKKR